MGYYKKNWMGKMEYIPDLPNNTETINIVDGLPVTTSNKTIRTVQNNPWTSTPQRTDVSSLFLKNQRNINYWDTQAKKYGFKSIDDVIDFLKKNGLQADGKVGKNTIAKIESLKGNSLNIENKKVENITNNLNKQNTSSNNNNKKLNFDDIASRLRLIAQEKWEEFFNELLFSTNRNLAQLSANNYFLKWFNIDPNYDNYLEKEFQKSPTYKAKSAPTAQEQAHQDMINGAYRFSSYKHPIEEVKRWATFPTVTENDPTRPFFYTTIWPNDLTSMRYLQQGGNISSYVTQQDKEEQLLQYALFSIIGANDDIDLNTAVSAIAEAYIKDPQSLTQVIQDENTIKQGMLKLELENPGSVKQITQPGFMKKVISKLVSQKQQGIKQAKMGTKLDYIKQLKNICPEGYEIEFRKAGGTVCPVCKKKHKTLKALEGNKIEKECKGGISKAMDGIKALMKCGGKVKKHGEGDTIDENDTIHFVRKDKFGKIKREVRDLSGGKHKLYKQLTQEEYKKLPKKDKVRVDEKDMNKGRV